MTLSIHKNTVTQRDRGEWYKRETERDWLKRERKGMSNERERQTDFYRRSTKQLLIVQKTNTELRETHTLSDRD